MIALGFLNFDIPTKPEEPGQARSKEREPDRLVSRQIHIKRGRDEDESEDARAHEK